MENTLKLVEDRIAALMKQNAELQAANTKLLMFARDLRFCLSDVVKGWNKLGAGDYSSRVITAWLKDDMKPVIDAARIKIGVDLCEDEGCPHHGTDHVRH